MRRERGRHDESEKREPRLRDFRGKDKMKNLKGKPSAMDVS